MTPEMTDKEKAIVKAYEELGVPIDMDGIPLNGYKKIKPTQFQRSYKSVDLLKINSKTHSLRPKSLSGIETNNGWTRIYSKDDKLPESETGRYYMSVNFTITNMVHHPEFVRQCVRETTSIIHVMPFELPKLKPIY